MRIGIVFPALPPAINGIGDHTARLAAELAEHHSVTVYTACEGPAPISGVEIVRAFSVEHPKDIWGLKAALQQQPPDWLILQFEQFAYGRWGLNLHLPEVMHALKRQHSTLRLALMAHEDFVPVSSWKFAVMTLWQRWQFWRLGRAADLVFLSTQQWAERYQRWFRRTPVRHVPIGSNFDLAVQSRSKARDALGLSPSTFVMGLFGSVHAVRSVEAIRRAVAEVRRLTSDVILLYIGTDGKQVRAALEGALVLDAGPLPAEEVATHFAAMDVYLAPFYEGVTTRRGSFMVGLQQGIPTVSTRDVLTDPMLAEQDGHAFLLAPAQRPEQFARLVRSMYYDRNRRLQVGRNGQTFYYTQFDWPILAQDFLRGLREVDAAHRRFPADSQSAEKASMNGTSPQFLSGKHHGMG